MATCTQASLADKRRWRGGVARDVHAAFNDLTLDITMQALFDARLHAADAKDIPGQDLPALFSPLAGPPLCALWGRPARSRPTATAGRRGGLRLMPPSSTAAGSIRAAFEFFAGVKTSLGICPY
jgi:hypothetical protein